jgi:hypothetical protein
MLTGGSTTSCGCARPSIIKELKTRHGHSPVGKQTPEYYTWCAMIRRCENQNVSQYHNYGGRGIRVCNEWRASFEAFLVSVGTRPSSKHSIDRIDVNGHYEPGNVRWADAVEQSWNKRDTRRITANGETLTLLEWSRRIDVSVNTLRQRIYFKKWDPARAVTTPKIEPAERAAMARIAAPPPKTHCPQGHPYEGDNLIVRRQKGGGINRMCRICRRSNSNAWKARRRASASAQTATTTEDGGEQ